MDTVQRIWPELSAIDPSIAVHLEIDAKYDVYLKRQTADVDAFRRDEGLVLAGIDYAAVPGLSNEARAKLTGRAAADRRAGGPARWSDAGGAGDSGGLSAPGSAKEDRVVLCMGLFHVKRALAAPTDVILRCAHPCAPRRVSGEFEHPRILRGSLRSHLRMTLILRRSKMPKAPASPILPADKAAALALTPVSRETEARLDRYVDLLLEWTRENQSDCAIDASKSLDPAYLGFAAALEPGPVGKDLGRSRQRRRLSRCRVGLRAGGAPAPTSTGRANAKKAAFLREAIRVTSAAGTVHPRHRG